MKNIEKYPNTKDALKAYNSLESENMPFDKWIECEFEEPREPTLLEAAEAVVLEASKVVTTVWFANNSLAEVLRKICDLSAVIEIEKLKAVRNCDKYKTAEDALKAFKLMCDDMECERCPYLHQGEFKCRIVWLYAKAEKEETR